jgi:hypothetical protein
MVAGRQARSDSPGLDRKSSLGSNEWSNGLIINFKAGDFQLEFSKSALHCIIGMNISNNKQKPRIKQEVSILKLYF